MTAKRILVFLFLVLWGCGDDGDGPAGASSGPDAGAEDAAAGGDAQPDSGDAGAALELPNPALVVASGESAEVSVLDPASLRAIATFPVEPGLHPHHLGVAPDGTRVLVTALSADFAGGHAMHGSSGANDQRTLVYELDLEAGTLEQVVEVQVTAHNAAYLADGRYMVLSMAEHGMIQTYDTYVFAESWWLTTGAGPLEVTPSRDGRWLVVCNSSDDTLTVIDVDRQEVTATVEIAEGPVGAWQSTDGSFWVSSETARSVSLLSDEPTSVDAVIELRGVPGQAFETPDGEQLWVTIEDRGLVAVYDAQNRELIEEIEAGEKPHGLAFDPSGARAFVTDENTGELLVLDVATHAITDRVRVGEGPNGVAWAER